MKKLSVYTIASNCANIDDLRAGIREIREEICNRDRLGKKIPDYYYIRDYKLWSKLCALKKKSK